MSFFSLVGCPPAVGLRSDSWLVSSSPELEMAKARNQLDAVLQCLLEKSHMDRLGPSPAGVMGRPGWIWVGPQRLA